MVPPGSIGGVEEASVWKSGVRDAAKRVGSWPQRRMPDLRVKVMEEEGWRGVVFVFFFG